MPQSAKREPSIALSFYKLRLSDACHGRGRYSTCLYSRLSGQVTSWLNCRLQAIALIDQVLCPFASDHLLPPQSNNLFEDDRQIDHSEPRLPFPSSFCGEDNLCLQPQLEVMMQNGSVIRRNRKKNSDIWQFRWRENTSEGKSHLPKQNAQAAVMSLVFSSQ